MGIKIGTDSHAVFAHVSIKGVSRSSEKIRDEYDGSAREQEKNVTERIEHEGQYTQAKKVEAAIRGAVRKFSVSTVLGNLTDATRLEGLRERVAELKREVDIHNTTNPLHVVRFDFQSVPIGLSLTPENQAALCREVQENLNEVRDLLLKGDFAGARGWVQNRKHLGALMPAVVGQVVEDAIGFVKESATTLAKAQRERGLTETDLAAMAAGFDFTPLDAAINWTIAPDLGAIENDATH